MWCFLIAFLAGGCLGFLICAIITSGAISEARCNEQLARDWARHLEIQKEQNK